MLWLHAVVAGSSSRRMALLDSIHACGVVWARYHKPTTRISVDVTFQQGQASKAQTVLHIVASSQQCHDTETDVRGPATKARA